MAKWLVLGRGSDLAAFRLDDIVGVIRVYGESDRSSEITLRNGEQFTTTYMPHEVYKKMQQLERDEQKAEGE